MYSMNKIMAGFCNICKDRMNIQAKVAQSHMFNYRPNPQPPHDVDGKKKRKMGML
jgi:hypothetical protein